MAQHDPSKDPFGFLGTTVADRYLVEQVAWRNALAVVYQARHVELQTRVALKVLRLPPAVVDSQREEFLAGFTQEAKTVAALNHPALVRMIDFGELDLPGGRTPWMALEWLDGRTLETDLAERPCGRRSPREALDLLRPAFDALACAHEAGVAHRDVKPANLVLVRERPGDPGLRVQGFGVAKSTEGEDPNPSGDTATASEISAWSPLYAAPEQLNRTRTGPWTDVHALALILVELLVGATAYGAAGGPDLFAAVLDRKRPTPARHGVETGPWEPVLAKALSLRPADRHRDAGALLADLAASVAGAQAAWTSRVAPRAFADTVLSTSAPPPAPERLAESRPVRVLRPTRARPALWIAVGLGLCAALLLGVWAALRSDARPAASVAPIPTPVVLTARDDAPTSPAPEPPVIVPRDASPAPPALPAQPPSAPAPLPTQARRPPTTPRQGATPPRHIVIE